jgi:hypothetical protein
MNSTGSTPTVESRGPAEAGVSMRQPRRSMTTVWRLGPGVAIVFSDITRADDAERFRTTVSEGHELRKPRHRRVKNNPQVLIGP